MDTKKIDLKKSKFAAGAAVAVMSGFVPQAMAGTATLPVDIDLVTAVTLGNVNGLDFGRIAQSGGTISGTFTLQPDTTEVTASLTNGSVVVSGTPGNMDITAGATAASVNIALSANVDYDGGDISIQRLTFGGPAFTSTVQVAGGGNANGSFGGGSTDIQVGGQVTFSGAPSLGAYTGNSFTVTINDIP